MYARDGRRRIGRVGSRRNSVMGGLFYEIVKNDFSVRHSFLLFSWTLLILVDQVEGFFLWRARATWRGGAVAPLVCGLDVFLSLF